jgi:hypothetical protein
MYRKSVSSGVESMNRAKDEIHQRMVVNILNAALILLKKESNRYQKARVKVWKHLQALTPKGMDLMEDAFKDINPALNKIHLIEMNNHH